MDLRQLAYVVAVAEEGNFTRAAARCHVVQSALSSQVARLERELGVPLFHRTSRAVRLAPAGELLLPHARSLLRGAELARAEVDAFAGVVTGRMRIGLIGSAVWGMPFVDELIAAFHRRHPAVEVLIGDDGSEQMAEQVRDGELDLAFVGLYAGQVPAELVHHLLAEEPLVAAVALDHPLAGLDRTSPAELAATSPFIELRRGTGGRRQADAAFDRAGVDRRIAFELGSPAAVSRFVGLGLGAALVPAHAAERAPDVAALALDDDAARHPVALVHLPLGRSTPAARAFHALLEDGPACSPGLPLADGCAGPPVAT